DVVQEEAVLEAGIVEERRVDRLRQGQGVLLDALCMAARVRILGLERLGERNDRLSVRMLEETPLSPLRLDKPTEIARIDEQLFRVRLASSDDQLSGRLGQLVDQRDQLERTERLAENRVRAGRPRLRIQEIGPRQQDHRRMT